MGYPIQQSTANQPLQFMLINSTDHISGLTGKAASVVVKISKAGAAAITPAGAITEVDATNAPGWYQVAANATDSNTLGPLILHAKDAASDPWDDTFPVVAYNPLDSTRIGLGALPNAVAGANTGLPVVGTQIPNASASAAGGLPTIGTGAGQIEPDGSGAVPIAFATALPASPAAGSVGEALKRADSNLDAAVSSRQPSGNVNVGGYAAGEDPASWVLATPANKLTTDASGHVTVGTNDDKTGYSLTTAEETAVANGLLDLANGVETGLTLRQALRLMAAALAGEVSGGGTTLITIKAANNPSTPRIVATVDSTGDRSSLTLTP